MKILKVCHACDRIIGELELDGLTSHTGDSTVSIAGNVAYVLCPGCLNEMEIKTGNVYH